MQNQEFARQLELRTRRFAVRIIRSSMLLPNTSEARVIKNQLTKSGSSVGANYREANRAKSHADFRNKIKICEGEASETQYWLEIIKDLGWLPQEKIDLEYRESSEILAIFTSISSNVR